jgi:acetyl esterase/lipase
VRIYTPRDLGGPAGVLVYFHGGGFIAGSVDSHDGTVRELAVGASCIAVSVEYRLAPEHPYPAGLDDCIAALRWTAAHAADIGGDPSRLAIGGDSAGGNFGAAVVMPTATKAGRRRLPVAAPGHHAHGGCR